RAACTLDTYCLYLNEGGRAIVPDGPETTELQGIAVMREFLAASPLAKHLGIEAVSLEPDRAELRLPCVLLRGRRARLGRQPGRQGPDHLQARIGEPHVQSRHRPSRGPQPGRPPLGRDVRRT